MNSSVSPSGADNETRCESVSFNPPLYIQRYLKVSSIIESFTKACHAKQIKVADLGCAELSLFQYLKQLKSVTQITLMDLDASLLKAHTYKVKPLNSDYIVQRTDPLTVIVVSGDARYPHDSLMNADVVTLIEVIEHLHEKDLPALCENLFAVIRPQLIIITTPNADYNCFFPNFTKGKFRHYDHKFEWTEQEFKQWCTQQLKLYPHYTVEYSGCGIGPEQISCSQIAVFKKVSDRSCQNTFTNCDKKGQIVGRSAITCRGCSALYSKVNSPKNTTHCEIIEKVVYPRDTRSVDERLVDEVLSAFSNLRLFLLDNLKTWDMESILKMNDYSSRDLPLPWNSLVNQVNQLNVDNNLYHGSQPNAPAIYPCNGCQECCSHQGFLKPSVSYQSASPIISSDMFMPYAGSCTPHVKVAVPYTNTVSNESSRKSTDRLLSYPGYCTCQSHSLSYQNIQLPVSINGVSVPPAKQQNSSAYCSSLPSYGTYSSSATFPTTPSGPSYCMPCLKAAANPLTSTSSPLCSSSYSLVPNEKQNPAEFRVPEQTFVYEVADDTFLCLISTFCSWGKLKDETRTRKILERCGVPVKEVNGDPCLVISYDDDGESVHSY